MKPQAMTSISEITPFQRQKREIVGETGEPCLWVALFIIEWQTVEQSMSLRAKCCGGRQRFFVFQGDVKLRYLPLFFFWAENKKTKI